MLTIYPSFFPKFQCKADKCRHTCCQTWEIDIDPVSEKRYRAEKGPLGDELRAWMTKGTDGADCCFRLNEKGTCHFLTESGLCRLVLEKGEGYLCDICHAHPRFYKYVGDFELCGTGLCCEKTCEDLAAAEGPLTFLAEGNDPFCLPDLVYTLGVELPDAYYEWAPDTNPAHFRALITRMQETEPLEKAWTDRLTFMARHPDAVLDAAARYAKEADPALFQRFFHYIWYRALGTEVPMEILAAYAWESTNFIFFTAALTGHPLTAAASWSTEIEYDTENVDILLRQLMRDNGMAVHR